MQRRKGFTLIEMLVVVAIIGLLASVVVVGLGSSRTKARDSKRIADIHQLQTLMELNYTNSGGYDCDVVKTSDKYLDPSGNQPTYGCNSPTENSYTVWACLEEADNEMTQTQCPGASCSADTYTGDYIYCVTTE